MKPPTLMPLEGLISDAAGEKLAELAAAVPKEQTIVEIGSYKGKSTVYLGLGAKFGEGATVFAIDPWDSPGNAGGRFGFNQPATRQAFRNQIALAGLEGSIIPCRGFSTVVAKSWKRPVGLLFIDGSHVEKDVRADWLAWSPFLAPGSVVVFDDYDTPRNPGVTKVVDRLIAVGDRRWEFGPEPLAIGFPE